MNQRNHLLEAKITASSYKSVNALAKAINVPSDNIVNYLTCKRRPVDRRGALKYDVALLCCALDCYMEDLFPSDQIDTPYVIIANYPQCEESDMSYDPQKIRYHSHTPIVKMITLSDDHLAELQRLHKTTAIGASALLKGQRKYLPVGLDSTLITGWLKGKTKTARKDHIDFVLTLWRSKLDNDHKRIELTPAHKEKLTSCRDRSGVGSTKLFKQLTQPPKGLTAAMIDRWLADDVLTVREDHLKCVLSEWEKLALSPTHHQITASLKEELNDYKARCYLGTQSLFNLCEDIPEGLTFHMVSGWLDGSIQSARIDHIAFIRGAWKDICKQRQEQFLSLDDKPAFFKTLEKYRRLMFLPSKIFSNASHIPDGLSPHIINHWFTKPSGAIRQDYVDWVIEQCKVLEQEDTRVIILTDDMIQALDSERTRSGSGASQLFNQIDNIPDGITMPTISRWINGYAKTIRKDHYDFILAAWKALPDKA